MTAEGEGIGEAKAEGDEFRIQKPGAGEADVDELGVVASDGTLVQAAGPQNSYNAAVRWGARQLLNWWALDAANRTPAGRAA